MLCILGFNNWTLHNPDSVNRHKFGNSNSIYGEWIENKTNDNTNKAFKVIFFPGGKINVIRPLHNYIGYFKIYKDNTDQLDGTITIAEAYPFTATFIKPDEIKLVISYQDKVETKYLVKTKEIRSGFQLID